MGPPDSVHVEKRDESRIRRGGHWRIMIFMLLSFLPIASVVFIFCVGAGVLLALLLSETYYAVAAISLVFLIVILGPMLGPLAYRFLARAFPLNASGERNSASLQFLRHARATMLIVCLGLVAWGLSLYWDLLFPSGDLLERMFGALAVIWLVVCFVFLLFSTCLTWGLIKLIRFHDHPSAWASERFILFLRSFGSVSDSAALGILVRGAGVRARVALLSSPREVMASWDPMTLVVAGFSFRHPFHSVPVYLESTDQRWSDDVRRMAGAAKLVVIDTSHRSPGLSQEIELLSRPGLSEKTVRFEELPDQSTKGSLSDSGQKNVIFLEKSRVARRVSQVMGFIFTYVSFVILTAVGVTVVDPKWSSTLGAVFRWSSLLYSLVPAFFAASALSPEAGFTRRSAAGLVQVIRQRIRAA